MSNPSRAAGVRGGDGKDGDNNDIEKTLAKTAGVVVFCGIAMSILKALNPFNKSNEISTPNLKMESPAESTRIEKTLTQPLRPCSKSVMLPVPQEPVFETENPVASSVEQNVVEPTRKAVEIVKGDTLWGLSREHGVSIEAIKEANGLTGDTIYAGKKLIIP